MKQLVLLLSVFVLAVQSGQPVLAPPAAQPDQHPKNIILLVGDGMGLTQVTAGMYAKTAPLHLERFPVTGLIKTHSAKNLITDSAAGATAFACGCKTYNGAIGMTVKKKPCPTLLEQAEAFGLATGLVATSSITHATPAAFIAHAEQRVQMEHIATYFVKTDIDLFIGGGMRYFTNRSDQRNLVEELRTKGFAVSDFSQNRLQDLTVSAAQPFAWFSAAEEPLSVEEGRDYLPAAARLAPKYLSMRSEKGFFLLVEGSQIDWACHANKGPRAILEMLDFDEAVGEALRFAEQDGQTLVIVTADHETGGMALLRGADKNSLEPKFTTDYHTASMVPVFAYGPGAERFGGVYDNTDIYFKIRALLHFPEVEAK
ncbi:MAG: alkaline phosphatase [Saprospiraceae bacterium]|nr:alkaline phosphatase [Saprospiraceae bacterium]